MLVRFRIIKIFRGLKRRIKNILRNQAYLAPEIIENKSYDRTVDWWALGIIIFEMLYGQLPFQHNNERVLYNQICNEEVKFPLDI